MHNGVCRRPRLFLPKGNFLSLAALLWLSSLSLAACFMHDRHALGYDPSRAN